VVRRPEEIDVSISVRSCFFSYSDSGTKAGKLRFEDMLVLGHWYDLPSLLEITGNVPEEDERRG
jgi:hypothetical protein